MERTCWTSLVVVALVAVVGCTDPIQPRVDVEPQMASANACWGQATKVFAQMGEMGTHSASQPTPRHGLARLAELLYESGAIAEPTMQALGAYVASELGLSIESCVT
jgi:hypothetical protein